MYIIFLNSVGSVTNVTQCKDNLTKRNMKVILVIQNLLGKTDTLE